MTRPVVQSWIPWLRDREQEALARAAVPAGFADGARTAANLVLLDEQLQDPELVVALAHRRQQEWSLAAQALERAEQAGIAQDQGWYRDYWPVLKADLAR